MTKGIPSPEAPLERYQEETPHKTWPDLPSWAQIENRRGFGERLNISEWDGLGGTGSALGDDSANIDQYRKDNGWKVSCLICK